MVDRADKCGILEEDSVTKGEFAMPKGCKSCSSCGFCTGPRAYICPKCNTPFVLKIKNKGRKNRVVRDFDWHELVRGDLIKVNGGPYFMNSDGEYVPMGYRGRFSVQGVDDKGILAWSTEKDGGYCHIYMGPTYHDKNTGLRKTPHTLLKIKKKEEV